MWADETALDATRRRLDEWEAGFAERARRAQALSARASTLTGTAHNPDRTVQVTVDAAGLLVDLRLDERIRQQSAAHTARQVLATTRAARADLLRQLSAATTETLGDDPAGTAILDSHRRRLTGEQGRPDAR
ncbi:YbaB/EbfC family DNA-binding protein [Micromonospora radicis]|uniref:YbaB/EbfC family DNA-binding protein n=1 Tax=Micromonospora radicis TaxID=1894971 RepID=A0A418N146_9ACTN|nr:YbaB/EbfC family DNA-binding protein [Micromonospora radicis]RIV41540.1 YbaB/EbfC family DNA-binding protein [Micromonospora radicis]